MKVIATNRKAYHDYHIEETFEAGIELKGTEVKSIREGKINLKDSYVLIKNDELWLLNCHISPYSHGNIMNHDPLRTRKLLMHKREIQRLKGKIKQKGYTLVALKVYFKNRFAKLEIALAKGKRQYEKRDTIKDREASKEIDRALKDRNRRL